MAWTTCLTAACLAVLLLQRSADCARPVFNSKFYSAIVPETTVHGSTIVTVAATDADNDVLMYSLSPGAFEKFRVNPSSGVISSNGTFDAETRTTYSFQAYVSDADTTFKDFTNVFVYINNVNEHEPQFVKAPYTRDNLPETATPGTIVATVVATDLDFGDQVQFSLVPGTDANKFEINSASGVVTTGNHKFDYDVQNQYVFSIEAKDTPAAGEAQRRANTTLTVNIQDIDTLLPAFRSPPSTANITSYNVNISESLNVNSLVLALTAIDQDQVAKNPLTFGMDSATPQSDFFAVDPVSGSVTLKKPVDYEDPTHRMLNFVVSVRQKTGLLLQKVTASVVVNVLDANDNAPEFSSAVYNVSVSEREAVGHNVLTLVATDRDRFPYNQFAFSLLKVNNDFRVVGNELQIATPLDHDTATRRVYSIVVLVTETGVSAPKSSDATVFIVVTDANDNTPVFSLAVYPGNQDENTPTGRLITKVHATDRDSGSFATIRYSITGGNTNGAFNIDNTTGDITNAYPLDYDTQKSYQLTVQAKDQAQTSPRAGTAKVNIGLFDLNDNSPAWQQAVYNVSISENSPIGSPLKIVLATDADDNANGKVSYTVQSSIFAIDSSSGAVTTRQSLDYESQATYVLVLIATDGGSPPRSNTSIMNIYVIDLNDNSPQFTGSPPFIRVAVEEMPGWTVLPPLINATDKDSGLNGEVRYSLSGTMASKFRIDSKNGSISASKLDYENPAVPTHEYSLQVTATDQSPTSPRSTSTTLTVQVTDVNDNPPVFTVNKVSQTILESADVGTTIVQLVTTDADTSLVATETLYNFTGANTSYGGIFTMDRTTGLIRLGKRIDFESGHQLFTIFAVAYNRYKPSFKTVTLAAITVNVQNVHDHCPHFVEHNYAKTIPENAVTPSTVLTVSAIDLDVGATLTYSLPPATLTDDFSKFFFIGPTNGILTLISSLDYEANRNYTSKVLVSDGQTGCMANTSVITVSTSDVNDNSPVFTTQTANQKTTVAENSGKGTLVATVAATDADTGDFGNVQYVIAAGNLNAMFDIDNVAGTVMVLTPPNYEAPPIVFNLLIEAHDLDPVVANRNTGTTMLEITVTDVNDNSPVFRPDSYSSSVPESSPANSVVDTVRATDADSPLHGNNKITYSITAGNNGAFAVDPSNGQLTTARTLDHETQGVYNLTIMAQDGGTPKMMEFATMIVTVTDVNDNPPVFNPPSYSVSVLENTTVTSILPVMINATDKDSGQNGVITYSFPSKNSGNIGEAWQINPNTGEISQVQTLDRETTPVYSLSVQAEDRGLSARRAFCDVVITILDVNDNAPQFSMSSYTATVAENQPILESVVTLSATDKDAAPDNNKVVFSITGDPGHNFNVDSASGLVTTSAEFDREKNSSFVVTVVARDRGTPSLSSTATLTVNVMDLNDETPTFSNLPFANQTIKEDVGVGTVVLRFTASDSDAPTTANSDMTFTMTNSRGKFNLVTHSKTTGSIVLASTLDYESATSYQLNLMVSDHGTPPKQSKTLLNIFVADANDNPPVFQQPTYTATVPENGTTAASLVTVYASDADQTSNALVRYSFTAGSFSSYFLLNSTSGLITSNPGKKLDYEDPAQRIISLTVTASDGKTRAQAPPSAQVRVTVTNVNDAAPTFLQLQYTATIPEDAQPGATVKKVDATDKDSTLLTYSLTVPNSYFFLAASTGVLTIKAALPTFEAQNTHVLFVRVTDGHWNATTKVTVSVENRNTNRPIFYPTNFFAADVLENVAGGHPIVTVYANDSDAGVSGQIEYKLFTRGDLFAIDISTGVLSLKGGKTLDRESQATYTLSVTANDKSGTSQLQLTSTAQVQVSVTDVDDQTPVFQFSTYSGSVKENQTAGLSVVTVFATDKDTGKNAQLYYNITGGNSTLFTIKDSSVGLITTAGRLDRESTPVPPAYTLTVTATDMGSAHLQNTTTVSVYVTDINDNPPNFVKKVYTVSIYENIPGALSILSVHSTDADIGTNADRTFSILSVVPASPTQFRMTADGVLETGSKGFDREAQPSFNLTIQVEDGIPTTTPRFKATATVLVTILDINDNRPQFVNAPYTSTVTESNASRGVVIATVSATDRDLALNRTLAFAITAGNTGGNFTINPISGVITVVGTLDREATGLTLNSAGDGVVTLTITAYDRNNTKGTDALVLTSTTTVTVTIMDANDNSPVFGPVPTSPKLPESTITGTTATTVTATDRDVGINAKLFYSIIGGTNTTDFAINSATGVITVANTLNAELHTLYSLVVKAADLNGAGLFATTNVYIDVTDVNEHAPVFTQLNYKGQVRENAPVVTGTDVTVLANDTDLTAANRNIVYSITAGNTNTSFAITPKGGVISTAKGIDRETTPFFSLTVTANDQGTPPLQGSCIVDITILDLNDNKPILERAAYSVSVVENIGPAESIVLSPEIKATDRDEGINKLINYTLSGTGSDQFSLDGRTGELFSANNSALGLPSIDREKQSSYDLTVRATDGGGLFTDSKLTVNVLDANDNYPMFDKTVYTVPDRYNEDTAVGTPFITVLATDSDDPASPNSVIHYTIVDGGRGHFTVGRTSGVISLAASLDRELEANYTLNVSATDGGLMALHNYTTVLMNVLDANDNSPIFQPTSSYTAVLPENHPPGQLFGSITATDADISTNGQVTYEVISRNSSGVNVQQDSGFLSTAGTFDYETRRSYRVFFKATDHGSPPRHANATLDLTITDVNDNAPKFSATGYSASFSETTVAPAQLLHFVANDLDSGLNGEVRYYLAGNSSFFAIDSVSGILSLVQPVSADAGFTTFTLLINATDLGTPPMTGLTTALITVNDINSHAPKFNQTTPYAGQVMENDNTSPSVLQVAAYELDRDGKSQPITFALSLNVGNKFKIDPLSGVIRALVPLDREKQSFHSLTAVATDGVHNSTAIVGITVLDANDNYPILPFAVLQQDVYENSANGTVVVPPVLITGSDADSGENGLLTYEFIGAGNTNDAFACDNATGVITVSNNLDRETLDSYVLVVEVHDNGSPANSATVTVSVAILDRNDNSPVFKPATFSASLKEDLGGGTTVVTVTASDADLGSNMRLTFGLAGGDMGEFRIEADTGLVHTVNGLDYETATSYLLNVSAHDNGRVPRYSYTTVAVAVQDVNDWTPMLDSPFYARTVYENVTIGTTLLTLNGSDGDGSSPNNQFTYHLTNCTPAIGLAQFYLHPDQGYITTTTTLDRERWDQYDFLITIRDRGMPSLSSTSMLSITVLDIDDNAPIFSPSYYGRLLSEGANIGDRVVTVTANDADIGLNGAVQYAVVAGDPLGHFDMQPASGLLTLVKSVDRETVNNYTLTVTATDMGPPRLRNTTTVYINVTDINDNIPAFVPVCNGTGITISAYENINTGSSVLLLNASDRDIGDNALLFFSITTVQNVFQVKTLTGNLTTKTPLDRELNDEYKITVEVRDDGSSPLSTFCNILVKVLDVNDNPPVFSQPGVVVNIPEDKKPGYLISDNTATDADLGNNSIVTYRILSGNDDKRFAIDPTSGLVTLATTLDRENASSYTIWVLGENKHATPVYNGTYQLFVRVVDVNDNKPVFSQQVFVVNITEVTAIGAHVFTVTAADPDEGPNAVLSYDIISGNSDGKILSFFELRNKTNLVVAHALDFEVRTAFTLVIRATDNAPDASKRLSGFATVIVNIVDVNDNAPHFLAASYNFNLRENGALGTDVGTVVAADSDTGVGRHITYTITNGSGIGVFTIDANSGIVTQVAPVDYEMATEYILQVTASNILAATQQGGAILASRPVTVTVAVVDVNDNTPFFDQPEYIAGIPVKVAPPHDVITVSASDLDGPPFGTVRYQLLDPPLDGGFSINSITGKIVSNELFPEQPQEAVLEVTVQAFDNLGNEPSNNANTTLTVFLLDPAHKAVFVFNQTTSEIEANIQIIKQWITNVTGAVIHIESVKRHIEGNEVTGEVSTVLSDVYVYAINPVSKEVITRRDMILLVADKLDFNTGDPFLRTYGVGVLKFIQVVGPPTGGPDVTDNTSESSILQKSYFVALITVGIILFLVLLFIVVAICCLRKRRKIRQRHQQLLWESNFFATPPASMSDVDHFPNDGISMGDQRELIDMADKKPKKKKKKSTEFQANPIWVQPYAPWEGGHGGTRRGQDGEEEEEEEVTVRTTYESDGQQGRGGARYAYANPVTTVEEYEETAPSAVSLDMRDNPLYESQEIKMDMFYTSDSDDDGNPAFDPNRFNDQSAEDLDQVGSDAQLLEATIELEETEAEDPMTLI